MKKNAKEKIKAHLERGNSITPAQAWDKYGCYRLASVINRLRSEGLKIHTELSGKEGYAKYYLIQRKKLAA